MNYYQHHIGDFKRDTNFLTHEERSVYLELMWIYYDEEHPLVNDLDLLARKCKANKGQIEDILNLFFILDDDGFWTHSRINEELSKMADKSEKASEAANVRWEKYRKKANQTQSKRNANAMQTHSERNANGMLPIYPIPNNPITHSKNSVQMHPNFDIFWKAYPNPKKKKEAIRLWNKYKPDLEKCLKAIEWQKDTEQWRVKGMIPLPTTWLNNAQWEDEPIKKIYRELG